MLPGYQFFQLFVLLVFVAGFADEVLDLLLPLAYQLLSLKDRLLLKLEFYALNFVFHFENCQIFALVFLSQLIDLEEQLIIFDSLPFSL